MAIWLVKEWDGNQITSEHRLPGNVSVRQIEVTLQRLVCRDLSVSEILAASRRKNDPNRTGILDRVGHGRLIDYGHGHLHYTAERSGSGQM